MRNAARVMFGEDTPTEAIFMILGGFSCSKRLPIEYFEYFALQGPLHRAPIETLRTPLVLTP
jgi:hypothetical protein